MWARQIWISIGSHVYFSINMKRVFFSVQKADIHDWFHGFAAIMLNIVSFRYGCTRKPKSRLETLSGFNLFCMHCWLLNYFGCRYFGQVTENKETISNVRSCMCRRRRTFLCIESKNWSRYVFSLSLWSESEIRSKCEASHEFWRHIKFFSNVWHECKKTLQHDCIYIYVIRSCVRSTYECVDLNAFKLKLKSNYSAARTSNVYSSGANKERENEVLRKRNQMRSITSHTFNALELNSLLLPMCATAAKCPRDENRKFYFRHTSDNLLIQIDWRICIDVTIHNLSAHEENHTRLLLPELILLVAD